MGEEQELAWKQVLSELGKIEEQAKRLWEHLMWLESRVEKYIERNKRNENQ